MKNQFKLAKAVYWRTRVNDINEKKKKKFKFHSYFRLEEQLRIEQYHVNYKAEKD